MSDAIPAMLRVHDADTVAVALRPLEAGHAALAVTGVIHPAGKAQFTGNTSG